jgi:hypothetical protein
MMPLHHKSLASMGLICACGLWLAGCAGGGAPFTAGNTDVVFSNKSMSVQQAAAKVSVGQSTKADVLAALGPATTLRFDSGHEVWVYRGKPLRAPATGAEFVILFAPSGTVQKTRTRPAYDGLTR